MMDCLSVVPGHLFISREKSKTCIKILSPCPKLKCRARIIVALVVLVLLEDSRNSMIPV